MAEQIKLWLVYYINSIQSRLYINANTSSFGCTGSATKADRGGRCISLWPGIRFIFTKIGATVAFIRIHARVRFN
jgi:hypothetical protein